MARILAIGAHPDDVEIGMGGTILALKEAGHAVSICDLTNGEPTPMGTVEARLAESKEAARLLGVDQRWNLDLPNRYLRDTVEARIKVAEVIRRFRPDAIFMHYWSDAHPDHVAANQLAEAGRFYAKLTKTDWEGEPIFPARIYCFFSNHFRAVFQPDYIHDISPYMERKLEALRVYRTQFNPERSNLAVFDQIKAMGMWWGNRGRFQFGEPFASREEIGLRNLEALL
ncbi:MAG: bacillithiol biosynthesis deacetylase BshB1 [bacterium]